MFSLMQLGLLIVCHPRFRGRSSFLLSQTQTGHLVFLPTNNQSSFDLLLRSPLPRLRAFGRHWPRAPIQHFCSTGPSNLICFVHASIEEHVWWGPLEFLQTQFQRRFRCSRDLHANGEGVSLLSHSRKWLQANLSRVKNCKCRWRADVPVSWKIPSHRGCLQASIASTAVCVQQCVRFRWSPPYPSWHRVAHHIRYVWSCSNHSQRYQDSDLSQNVRTWRQSYCHK